jgi:hypothetical protein
LPEQIVLHCEQRLSAIVIALDGYAGLMMDEAHPVQSTTG